jgi:hypothetical protein
MSASSAGYVIWGGWASTREAAFDPGACGIASHAGGRPSHWSSNGRQGTELADLIVHKITEAVNAVSFK